MSMLIVTFSIVDLAGNAIQILLLIIIIVFNSTACESVRGGRLHQPVDRSIIISIYKNQSIDQSTNRFNQSIDQSIIDSNVHFNQLINPSLNQ